MQSGVFDKHYYVHVYETGPDGKVSPWSLFNYMQDAASEHAGILGFGREDLQKNNNFWVLSRIYAEFYHWPAWKDRINVKTWPNGTDKMFAMRNYDLTSDAGEKLSTATSSWLVVDRKSRRIQRPETIIEHFSIPYSEQFSPVRSAEKLPSATFDSQKSESGEVRISDLDINLHTNNVNYLKWIIDTYELDFIMVHKLFSAEINYLAESVIGDKIIISCCKLPDGMIFDHKVVRESDNKELCRLRLRWEKQKENEKPVFR